MNASLEAVHYPLPFPASNCWDYLGLHTAGAPRTVLRQAMWMVPCLRRLHLFFGICMGISINGGAPKWIVYDGKSHGKSNEHMDDVAVPFLKNH